MDNDITISDDNVIIINTNKKKELLERINRSKNDTSTRLFMVTEAYDKYNKEYYNISLTILILSSIITFIEAFRLTINEYSNNNKFNSLLLNILLLLLGTIITILSSVVRFKNYREVLEGLKDSQTKLVNYKNKYSKQYFIIKYNNIIDNNLIKISDKITLYERYVKSINYFQYIKNSDIISYNKKKAKFDLDIYIIKTDTRNKFEEIQKKKEKDYINIYNESDINLQLFNLDKYQKINDILMKKEEYKFNISKKKLNLNEEALKLNNQYNKMVEQN